MIAVHAGAGNHHHTKHPKYKLLCKKACRAGMAVLKSGGTALEAVTAAIKVLEDDPITNAGYGSNLTTTGHVECDAAIMDGSNLLYGGCGCTTNIKNPIELACDLCIKQTQTLPVGLIPPSLLVGDGARLHAEKNGIKTVKGKELITKRAMKKLLHYSALLQQIECDQEQDKQSVQQDSHNTNLLNPETANQSESENSQIVEDLHQNLCDEDVRMDTVGAVCCDLKGHVAAGCSSGGLLLKRPGRVGQGALYASGVWADSFDEGGVSVAATTSGCGEYLVRTQLAKEVCEDLKVSTFPTPDLAKSMTAKFLDSRYLTSASDKNAGALVLHILPSGEGTVLWGHSTSSMSVGFMAVDDQKPRGIISTLPPGTPQGKTIMVGGSNFKQPITSMHDK